MDSSKIHRYVWIGRKDLNWYADCQHVFEDLFGPDRLELVCKLFAATSINTSLKSNITLFRRALYEIENNLPVGNYLPNIQTQLQHCRAGRPLSGRKISSFARAMAGDPDAVVVDIWLLRAFDEDRRYFRKAKDEEKGRGAMRSGGATDKQYTIIEHWVRTEARAMNLQARELSSMIWAGVRITQSGDTETHYKNILKHQLTNLFNVI